MSVTQEWVAQPVGSASRLYPVDRRPPIDGSTERVAYPVRGPSWIQSFFELPADVAVKLEASACKRTFRRGETVIRRGDRSDRLYLILRGRVKLLLGSKGRDDLLISLLGEGEYFGDAAMLDSRPWPVSAVAMESSEMYLLDRDVVLQTMSDCPELLSELLFNLTDHLRDTYEFIRDAIFLDVAGRVAKKLLDLARDYGRDTPEGEVIDIGLTQQDLARMVGVTRESVNKHLGAFKARGIIDMRDRRIVLCRPEELKRRIY